MVPLLLNCTTFNLCFLLVDFLNGFLTPLLDGRAGDLAGSISSSSHSDSVHSLSDSSLAIMASWLEGGASNAAFSLLFTR